MVLISGSSTGFTPDPRWAPSLARRRRTPTPGRTGCGCAAAAFSWRCRGSRRAGALAVPAGAVSRSVPAGSVTVPAGTVTAPAAAGSPAGALRPGLVAVAWSVAPRVSRGTPAVSSIRAASAPAVAVVITSPATSAPRICRGTSLLAIDNPRAEPGIPQQGDPAPGRPRGAGPGGAPGQTVRRERMSRPDRTERPLRNESSIRTAIPATAAPDCLTRAAVARAVPPVASTSSTISTRSPGPKASWCTSRVAVPYSSWYSCANVADGSLPFLRTGTKPAPLRYATGAARMNPRASIPATLSTGPNDAASASTTALKTLGSASSGVMSLNSTPGCG